MKWLHILHRSATVELEVRCFLWKATSPFTFPPLICILHYTDHLIAITSKGMLQPFFTHLIFYIALDFIILWSLESLSSVWLSPHCVTHVSFPVCIILFYSIGQTLILSLVYSLRAFTSWWAVVLLEWQHVSIRCNYIVKLPRGSLVDIKGSRIILTHTDMSRQQTGCSSIGFLKMWEAGARFRPVSWSVGCHTSFNSNKPVHWLMCVTWEHLSFYG